MPSRDLSGAGLGVLKLDAANRSDGATLPNFKFISSAVPVISAWIFSAVQTLILENLDFNVLNTSILSLVKFFSAAFMSYFSIYLTVGS